MNSLREKSISPYIIENQNDTTISIDSNAKIVSIAKSQYDSSPTKSISWNNKNVFFVEKKLDKKPKMAYKSEELHLRRWRNNRNMRLHIFSVIV